MSGTSMFQKATKKKAKLRAALVGPAGSGKTYSALAVAAGLGGKVAVIDTEHGSASKYAGIFTFDTVAPESYSPDVYVEAIRAAEEAGYDVLVIDSLSHAWVGKDGILEYVDQRTKASKSGNAFSSGWRDATPKHNALVEAILACKCHVIATMRSKTEYVLEEDKHGKKVPRKVGMAPVQRDGLEYEFDLVGDLDLDNNLVVTKTRCPALTGKVVTKPGAELAKALSDWLSDGVDAPEPPRPEPKKMNGAAKAANSPLLDEIKGAWLEAHANGYTAEKWTETVKAALGAPKPSKDWTAEDLKKVRDAIWPPIPDVPEPDPAPEANPLPA